MGLVRMPLTEAQQGIWMGQRLVPDSAIYWTAEALTLQGDLRLTQWLQAVDHVMGHAQSLHMKPAQDAWADYPSALPQGACRPGLIDVSDQAEPWLAAWRMAEAMRPRSPIDGSQDACTGGSAHALFQQTLIKVGPQDHVWLLWAHHLVLDGYGFTLLHRALALSYECLCQGRPLPSLAHWTMGAVVDEDIMRRDGEPTQRAAAYWRQALAGARTVSFAPPVPLAASVRRAHSTIEAGRFAAWRQAAADRQIDWPSWLLAGVASCLAAQTGSRDLVLGLPLMNRMGSKALSVPCMAMNIVPLRVSVQTGQSHAQLASAIMGSLRSSRPHQRYRYERLRHDLGRMGGQRRLFGPVVNIMPFDRPVSMHDIQLGLKSISAGPVEDLAINLIAMPDGALHLVLEGNPLSYSQSALQAVAAHLLQAWQAALDKPDDALKLAGMPATQAAWAPSPLPAPWFRDEAGILRCKGPALGIGEAPMQQGSVVLGALAAHALARPDHTAVRCGQASLSHAQLWAQAQHLAASLSLLLSGDDAKVLVMLPRHARTLALILGVWQAGACYIPLDAQTPPERLALVLDDARPDLIVTTSDLAHRFDGHGPVWAWPDARLEGPISVRGLRAMEPSPGDGTGHDRSALGLDTQPPIQRHPQDTAYVIYTSGSTGRPNGVAISHAALAHFLVAAGRVYAMQAQDRVLQFAPLHFDASIEELFLPLMAGATVLMRDDAMLVSPHRFLDACRQWQVSVLDLPTAYWHELAQALDSDAALRAAWPKSIRLVIIGGEAAQAERVRRWRQAMPGQVVLLNTYGPTEATVICSTAVLAGPGACDVSDGIPIGLPLPGLELCIVPTGGEALPHNDPVPHQGELFIVGPALAKAYMGQPALTAQRFAPLPGAFAQEAPRSYRTGDMACIDRHGQLIFAGRVDDEIKISGHRIDPLEVESAMLACPGVEAAAVLGQVLPNGDKRLLAFVVFTDGQAQPTAWWRERLLTRLPAPALPTCYLPLDHLPRNHNNKVDRQALRARLAQACLMEEVLMDCDGPQGGAPQPAMSSLEAQIAEVWQGLLGRAKLAPDSDFFAMGGASLQAIQACTRLGLRLQREVPVSWLFAHPTIAELAKALLSPVAHHPPPASAGQELAPLLPIQRPDHSQGKAQGTSPLLLCIHPAEGLSWCYFGLCRHLPGTEIWGIQSPGMTGEAFTRIEDLIDSYVALVRRVRPHGPYHLLGWSSGGGLAQAMATRLQAEGETVSLLAMMDAYPADIWEGKPDATEQDALEALLDVVGASAVDPQGQRLSVQAMRAVLGQAGSPLAMLDEALRERLSRNALDGMRLYRSLRHQPFQGGLLFFKAVVRPAHAPLVENWAPHVKGPIDIIDIDSNHNGMSQPAPLAAIGRVLRSRIEGVAGAQA